MKKYYLYLLPLLVAMLGFASCSSDEELTDSRLTKYVKFEMKGEDFVESPIGVKFVDPGCTATLEGEDYTSRITITGLDEIDENVPGLYDVVYSGVNKDGFTTSVTRTVAVCDPSITTDISGDYLTVSGTKRIRQGVETPFLKNAVTITKKASGLFYVDDMIGGFYAQGVYADYGDLTAMKGYILLHADNTITGISATVDAWGDSYAAFTEGKYDETTGTVTWNVLYSGMNFILVLNKKQ